MSRSHVPDAALDAGDTVSRRAGGSLPSWARTPVSEWLQRMDKQRGEAREQSGVVRCGRVVSTGPRAAWKTQDLGRV